MGNGRFKGAVFDLDGVVTHSAGLHAESWKHTFDDYLQHIADEEGVSQEPFSIERDYRDYVDGRPRIDGVVTFLRSRGIDLPLGEVSDAPGYDTAWAIGNLKNERFRSAVRERGVAVAEESVALISTLRQEGIPVAVATSSKNCSLILQSTNLEGLFDASVDGVVSEELGLAGKPAPDIFLEAARRLRVEPENCAVVEDATSGVQAGRAGEFGLVIGVAEHQTRLALRDAGADWIVERFGPDSRAQISAWFQARGHRRPSALAAWDGFVNNLQGRSPVLFLDYDGTLTPIVSRPEQAVLSAESREALRCVAETIPTAIISGRGRPDVEQLVGIRELAFAGSHGLDIIGRDGEPIAYELEEWIEPLMQNVSAKLQSEIGSIEGCIIEPKRFSVAAHYRLVPSEHVARIESTVDGIVHSDDRLVKASGKKVFEIRPAVGWDKGKALHVLLDALDLASDAYVPIYIGDDVTDEDAFRALRKRGLGILVSESPRATQAGFWLQDTPEVFFFLERLRAHVEGGHLL